MGAVGIPPMAVDNSWQCRPQEKSCKPAHYQWCGRCGRYFEAFVRDIVLLAEASSTTRAFQSRLERVCSRGEDFRGPWSLTGCCEASKRHLRTPRSGRPGLW